MSTWLVLTPNTSLYFMLKEATSDEERKGLLEKARLYNPVLDSAICGEASIFQQTKEIIKKGSLLPFLYDSASKKKARCINELLDGSWPNFDFETVAGSPLIYPVISPLIGLGVAGITRLSGEKMSRGEFFEVVGEVSLLFGLVFNPIGLLLFGFRNTQEYGLPEKAEWIDGVISKLYKTEKQTYARHLGGR